MVMKTENSLYVCANLHIKNLNNINIARLYSCVLSQLGPAVMERTVAKNRYGILDVAFSRRGKLIIGWLMSLV